MAELHQQELTEARINIARLESTVAYLTASIEKVEANQAAQGEKLDQVLATLSEARGGWRTLMLVGGAASAAGGLISWAVTHFVKA